MQKQMSNQGKKIINIEELQYVEAQKFQSSIMHRSIGSLTFFDKNGQMGYGTAVLLSKNLIVTAASNIFNKNLKSENSNFRFFIRVDAAGTYYHEIEGWRYPQQFKDCWKGEMLQFNFAVLKLKTSVAFNEYLPLHTPCLQCVWHKQMNLFGFPWPLDEEGKTGQLHQYGLSRQGSIVATEPAVFKIGHRIPVRPGMSGCPLVMENAIIAIHVGREGQCNIARIIDISLVQAVQKWERQLGGANCTFEEKKWCPHKLKLGQGGPADIEWSDYTNILELDLSSSNLEQIDLTHLPQLRQLNLSLNQLLFVDLAFNTLLTHLNLQNNRLEEVDVSGNTNLESLNLIDNKINEIDVSSNAKLKSLYLYSNSLTSIDLSKNINLINLFLSNNNISSIDLQNNTRLVSLQLQYNQIEEIDLSNNVLLELIWLGNNSLSAIGLKSNTNLKMLWLHWNYLDEIDIRINKQLEQLRLDYNSLGTIHLNISEKTTKQIYIGRNQYGEQYFSFSKQRSAICGVQLTCESEAVRGKAFEIANEWRERYSDIQWNDQRCQYTFVVL